MSGADPEYTWRSHSRLHFLHFCVEVFGSSINAGIDLAHGGRTFSSLSFKELFKSITGSDTPAQNTCKISQLLLALVTARRAAIGPLLLTSRMGGDLSNKWHQNTVSSGQTGTLAPPTHKISLPYKSQQPRALFLPKETYSLNVVGLMANE